MLTDDDIERIGAVVRTVVREEVGRRRRPREALMRPDTEAWALADAWGRGVADAAAALSSQGVPVTLPRILGPGVARAVQMRAAVALRAHGWRKARLVVDGRQDVRGWRGGRGAIPAASDVCGVDGA